jgi:putative DNA methylase
VKEGARPARDPEEATDGETPSLPEGVRPARHPEKPADGETLSHRSHRGWHVPHPLPHFDSPETVQAITFRLGDALPRAVLLARAEESGPAYRRRIAQELDAGHGACLLREPAAAALVEAALFHGAGERYHLHAWVIMPNHVHVLITPFVGYRLADIVQAWKSWTAKAINRQLQRTGSIWQREYFDRFMRDDKQLEATIAYIEQNPVKAGLIGKASEWRFGSAWWRKEGPRPARHAAEAEAEDGETPSLLAGHHETRPPGP